MQEKPSGRTSGKGKNSGCTIVASLFWLPVAKLGPLLKTLSNSATSKMLPDPARPQSLTPEVPRPRTRCASRGERSWVPGPRGQNEVCRPPQAQPPPTSVQAARDFLEGRFGDPPRLDSPGPSRALHCYGR